jgi:hypothetical protein
MIRTFSSSNSGFSFFQYSNTPVLQDSSLSLLGKPFNSDLAQGTMVPRSK